MIGETAVSVSFPGEFHDRGLSGVSFRVYRKALAIVFAYPAAIERLFYWSFPMNYINRLQSIIGARQAEAIQREERIIEFRAHLQSPKFHTQPDGERGDLISTADVARWLDYVNAPLEL